MTPLPKKKDPSITFLNKFGYNVIKLPRTGIEPMDLIGRDQVTQWLGPIRSVWEGDPKDPEPMPGPPHPASAVNGQRTDALEISLGLSVLANALAAFGASMPSLNAAYKSAHSVQFAYTNVTSTSVSTLLAGNYLASGKLRTDNPVVKNYLYSDKSMAFLIIEVLKSNSITVSATGSNGEDVGISLPAVQGLVGAKIDVKPSNTSNSTITFTGPEAVTFGFSVQQIARDGENWTLHGAAPSADIAFAGPGFGAVQESDEAPNPLVFDTGDFDCCLSI